MIPRYHAWLTGADTARFCHPRLDQASLPPFPGFITQPSRTGPLPEGFPIRPRFSTRHGCSHVELFNTRPASLYATGEQAGPLLRNGTRKTLWNTDSYDYTEKTASLYQSHPFILGVRRGSAASFGVIIETTYRCTIDLRPGPGSIGIAATTHGPPPAITVILRNSPQEVIGALARLTGRISLPPLWALGYHQCRYSYMSGAEVRGVASGFRDRNIPCDAIWLDIDYMDGFRSFTVNKETFPDPSALVTGLHKDGFKVVAMIDPGLKVDVSYEPFTQGRDQGHFVRQEPAARPAGVPTGPMPPPPSPIYEGPVWPGPCAFPDFTNAAARHWFGDLYQPLLALGINGFWNDMNEPAVFVPSKTMPLRSCHNADEDLGGAAGGDHGRYHNIYGAQMARATHDALARLRPDKRPFVLTRAGFLGSQRHAATWTGDNRADWDHLRWSIPMALNLSLSAQPFCGPDIGGFLGDTDPELFARWMGIGALLPFCRSHKNKGTRAHEPWELGEDCEAACRLALERRYRLLPYLYTLFQEAAATGMPIIRPLFFSDPADPRLRTIDDAFLLGDAILVQARVRPGAGSASATFPRGRWRPLEVTDSHPALPGLFLRAGKAVPLAPVMQHTGERMEDPPTLLAALDDEGQAIATLYQDSGEGHDYRRGDFSLTTFQIARHNGVPAVHVVSARGVRPSPAVQVSVL